MSSWYHSSWGHELQRPAHKCKGLLGEANSQTNAESSLLPQCHPWQPTLLHFATPTSQVGGGGKMSTWGLAPMCGFGGLDRGEHSCMAVAGQGHPRQSSSSKASSKCATLCCQFTFWVPNKSYVKMAYFLFVPIQYAINVPRTRFRECVKREYEER